MRVSRGGAVALVGSIFLVSAVLAAPAAMADPSGPTPQGIADNQSHHAAQADDAPGHHRDHDSGQENSGHENSGHSPEGHGDAGHHHGDSNEGNDDTPDDSGQDDGGASDQDSHDDCGLPDDPDHNGGSSADDDGSVDDGGQDDDTSSQDGEREDGGSVPNDQPSDHDSTGVTPSGGDAEESDAAEDTGGTDHQILVPLDSESSSPSRPVKDDNVDSISADEVPSDSPNSANDTSDADVADREWSAVRTIDMSPSESPNADQLDSSVLVDRNLEVTPDAGHADQLHLQTSPAANWQRFADGMNQEESLNLIIVEEWVMAGMARFASGESEVRILNATESRPQFSNSEPYV